MKHSLQSGETIWFVGDPHLGRTFETGVPLHRRGEREARQFQRFVEELATDCDINIMVGDLFDHPQVSDKVRVAAADAYLAAARARPTTQFFVMAGNHDRSRQLDTVGAWEIFRRLVEGKCPNLKVIDVPGQFGNIALFPWQWGVPAAEQVANFRQNDRVELAVGHWDLQSFGGSDDHLAPTELLFERFPHLVEVVSGHYHIEGNYPVGKHMVRCTGSLEPFTHAEDPEGELYVTVTLDELAGLDVTDKCVRVLLSEGEELPVGLDCLALTGKRLSEINDDESVAEKLGTFDWQKILDECLKGVPAEVRAFIDERLH